ncbi:MAG TPA: class I SAM-dependent methyltransferase [Acidimicrobiales bacterium]|nr:class I SAM-dependent methyltransferase [Acidimicrobiales bacterium]
MSLREAWDSHAEEWIRWVRTPGHDSYDQFHGERFRDLLPPPGALTVDVGGGEGRLGRDLQELGHRVVALDGSMTLARACATHHRPVPVIVADVAAAPVRSGCADLVVALMSLQDVDDLESAVSEAARLLAPSGHFCLAIVHPLNSAGVFEGDREDPDAPFVVRGSYLSRFRYHEEIERNGLPMTFHSEHRPLEVYSRALEAAGFVIEALREVTEPAPADRWSRVPLFLHIRALRL